MFNLTIASEILHLKEWIYNCGNINDVKNILLVGPGAMALEDALPLSLFQRNTRISIQVKSKFGYILLAVSKNFVTSFMSDDHNSKCPILLPTKYAQDTAEQYLERLMSFYKQYHWLIHVLASNFVTLKEWENLPISWRDALMDCMEKAGDEWSYAILDLTSDTSDYSIWPESLREYLQTARDLALPRAVDVETKKQQSISKHILGGMSDKKIHEVQLLSQVIKQVADEQNICSIIDLGSGQGYLSRALAFDYGFEVLAVDMSEIQTKGALKYDKKAMKLQGRSNEKEEEQNLPNLKHVTEKITPENISQVLARWSSDSGQDKQWLVTGLHTCGDLSPMIFNLFEKSKEVGCAVNVGCCYQALTESGFPMSSYLKKKQENDDLIHMGSTAKVLACHSPSLWEKGGEQCIKAFDNYFFRALLQEMLVERGLSDINDPPRLGRIKQNKDFVPFVKASLKRLKLPEDTITAEEAAMHYTKTKENGTDKQFVTLWTLRVMLAPIVESIILVDRWIYLQEVTNKSSNPNKGAWMYPLFDLSASPRNVAFVASK